MIAIKKVVLIGCLFCLFSCNRPDISPLEKVLWSAHPAMLKVLHDPEEFEIQILYSEIHRDSSGKVSFRDHEFRNAPSNFFYPASTVKLPLAVLAFEFADFTEKINIETPYKIRGDSLTHTIEDDVRQIFAVSDNQAYNRLYELLGRDFVNSRLQNLGLSPIRISHRLESENAGKAERDSLLFFTKQDTLYLGGGKDSLIQSLELKKLKKGIGFMRDGKMIKEPMDFSHKNYFPLETQHNLMKHLFFPEYFREEQRFKISEKNIAILKELMHTVPRKNGYSETDYYDSYGKFFIYGDSKERIPDHFKIYNKVGYAYGTLTETAYIIDKSSGIEFLLSATILVNNNEIFNDNTYEYETLGIPFLAQLGREIYLQEYEKNLK